MRKIFNFVLRNVILSTVMGMFSVTIYADSLVSENAGSRIICYDTATGTESYYYLDEASPNDKVIVCEPKEASESTEKNTPSKGNTKNNTAMSTKEVRRKAALSKRRLSLEMGGNHRLTLKNAVSKQIKWESSNKRIASVRNGLIWGEKVGKCDIIANYNGKRYKCKVSVIRPNIKLSIRSFNKNTQKLNLRLKNRSRLTIGINDEFTLKICVNNKWSKVRFLPGVQFESYARLVEPNKKADLDIALSKYFNTLSKGKYRVIYELGSHGRVHADFMVD